MTIKNDIKPDNKNDIKPTNIVKPSSMLISFRQSVISFRHKKYMPLKATNFLYLFTILHASSIYVLNYEDFRAKPLTY